jgi:hypothetical protein
MDKLSTTDVVKRLNVRLVTAQKWAQKNQIEAIRSLNGGVVTYLWSEDDIARFQKRPKPGRRWHKEEEEKKMEKPEKSI